jgi:NitT/TauT family transport system substrate-binding protein
MSMMQTRRRFLTILSATGAAGFLRTPPTFAAEGPPELTSVRFAKFPAICFAPQYVCEELLRAEGFTDIRYLDTDGTATPYDLGRSKFDFATSLAMQHIGGIDAGAAITIVSGVHAGCYELFAQPGIRGIADLNRYSQGLFG